MVKTSIKHEPFIRQESRKIVTAVMNQITYSEYLPLVLGPKYMKAFGLEMKRGYWDGKSDLVISIRVFCHACPSLFETLQLIRNSPTVAATEPLCKRTSRTSDMISTLSSNC